MESLVVRKLFQWLVGKQEFIALSGLLLVAGCFLVIAADGIWFFGDDWEFIIGRRAMWSRNDYVGFFLHPHNEHLSAIPIVIYSVLIKCFGIGSEIPFLVVLILSHLAVSVAVYTFIARSGGGIFWRLIGAGWFAVLGAGAENLLWAFQIGFVLALALGLWQLLLVDHDGPVNSRDVVGAGLGVLSICTSGVGFTMVAMVGLLLVYRRRWISLILGSGLPFLLYALWYLAYGHSRVPQTPHKIAEVPSYAIRGLTHGLDRVVQVPSLGLIVVIAALVVVLCRSGENTRIRELNCVLFSGLVCFYVLSGYGRSYLGIEQATASRYVYIAGALSIPLIVSGCKTISTGWKSLQILGIAFFAFAIFGNVSSYFLFRDQRMLLLDQVRPQIEVASLYSRLPITTAALQPEPVYSPDVNMAGLASLLDSGALVLPQTLSEPMLLEGAIKFGVTIRESQPSESLLGDLVTLNTVSDGAIQWGEQGCLTAVPDSAHMTLSFIQGDSGFITVAPTDLSVAVAIQTTSGVRSDRVELPDMSDQSAYIGMWPQTGWPILLIEGTGSVSICGFEPS